MTADPHRFAARRSVDRITVLANIKGVGLINHSMTRTPPHEAPARLARAYPRRRIEIVEVRRMEEYKQLLGPEVDV